MSNNKGIIDISALSTPPEKHELYTAKFFADKGKNITFICPSSIPEVYRPDILMDGKEWEIKSPIGKGKKQCISQLKVEFDKRQYLCRLLIITKTNELLECVASCKIKKYMVYYK